MDSTSESSLQSPRRPNSQRSLRINDADTTFEAVDTIRHAASVIRSLRSSSSSLRYQRSAINDVHILQNVKQFNSIIAEKGKYEEQKQIEEQKIEFLLNQDISIESVNNSFRSSSHITEDKSDVEFDDNILKKTEEGILISNNREKASNSCKSILKSTDDFDKEKNFYHRNDNDNNFWSKKDNKNDDNKTEKSEFQKTNQASLLNKNYDEEFDFSDDELDEKNEIENESENLSQYNENEFQNTRRKKSSEILKEKINKSRRDENNRYLQNHENRDYGECGENHSFASDGDIEGLSDDDEMDDRNALFDGFTAPVKNTVSSPGKFSSTGSVSDLRNNDHQNQIKGSDAGDDSKTRNSNSTTNNSLDLTKNSSSVFTSNSLKSISKSFDSKRISIKPGQRIFVRAGGKRK